MSAKQRLAERQRILLEILVEAGEPLHRNTVMERLEQRQPPLADELQSYSSSPGVSKYRINAHFYSVGLVKSGWITKDGGMWSATPDGVEALKKFPNPNEFFKELEARYKAWKESQGTTIDFAKEPEDIADAVSVSNATDQALSQIRDYLAKQPWQAFQDLVVHLLRAMGWHVVYKAEEGADRGLDIVAYDDPLGARGTRIKVQVKRYSSSSVAADVVERTASKLNDTETGVIVTLSGFTREATLAARDSKDRVTLIDGKRLIELWSEYYDRIPEEGRAFLRLRKVSYLDLES